MKKREGNVTVFTAKKIITMDRARPECTAVAVMDGKILTVGTMESIKPWLNQFDYKVDETFKDKVITPGFIDPHMHTGLTGMQLMQRYVGYLDYDSPHGRIPGYKTREDVLAALKKWESEMTDPNEPLLANGYEMVFMGGHLHRDELDAISTTRMIWVMGYAPHAVYANTPLIDAISAEADHTTAGVMRGEDGKCNGVFAEYATLLTMPPVAKYMIKPGDDPMKLIGNVCTRGGVTMVSEMAHGLLGGVEGNFESFDKSVNQNPDYPVRVHMCCLHDALEKEHGDDAPAYLAQLTERNTDRLFFGGVKFVTDGSVPVLTLKLNWPEYLEGGNGNRGDVEYNQLFSRMLPYWQAGIQLHVHTNGDASIDATLDALQKLQDERPRFNHRFCLEHYVVSNPSQAKRLADLGGCASVNVTYVNTRAQRFKDIVMGPDRAESMGRLASLEAEGVTFGLHSDYALVPLNPLLHIYTAVTRLGLDGKTVYGPGERIGVQRALRAVTIDAAYLLEKESTHGSIEQGKVADFAVLEEDPLTVDPTAIKDIKIWGTILGGKKQPFIPMK